MFQCLADLAVNWKFANIQNFNFCKLWNAEFYNFDGVLCTTDFILVHLETGTFTKRVCTSLGRLPVESPLSQIAFYNVDEQQGVIFLVSAECCGSDAVLQSWNFVKSL